MTRRLLPIVDRTDEDFRALARRENWTSTVDAWMTREGDTAIQLVHDPATGIRYLAIKGEREAEVASRLSGDAGWFYPRDIILEAPFAAETTAEAVRAIHNVGISAPPEYDAEYFELFEAFCDHPEAEVRVETLVAMAFPNWPELRTVAEFVRNTDPESGVRAAADGFLTYEDTK